MSHIVTTYVNLAKLIFYIYIKQTKEVKQMTNKEKIELALKLLKELEEILEQYSEEEINNWE